jgi:hypothetical protein
MTKAALTRLDPLHDGRRHPYQRILGAGDEELIATTKPRTREVGFWDRGTPFPAVWRAKADAT